MAEKCLPFTVLDSRFLKILGLNPTLELLLENSVYPFAHEAGVYLPLTDEIFITSNQFPNGSDQQHVQISKVSLGIDLVQASCQEIASIAIPRANGGVNYEDGVLFCGQGSETLRSGIYRMNTSPPYESSLLVSDYHGRPFNSPNDVVVHSDGSIWFTDPIYGFEQGFRPKPQLPNQVYRYEPATRNIRAMADGFGRPNGICFAPDETVVYVTDTDRVHGDGSIDGSRVSSIYAFDVEQIHERPFMTHRRLFAMAAEGIPDGIKCDKEGNVYSGCGDGVNVWSAGGDLLGIIRVEGGVANFCFGRQGAMYLLNENRIWKAQLADATRGALLGV